LNLETGRVQKIADLRGQLRGWGSSPSVSVDGRTVIFAVNSQMTGDIMLIEGFR
jgi:Tol biopolymer transport system component